MTVTVVVLTLQMKKKAINQRMLKEQGQVQELLKQIKIAVLRLLQKEMNLPLNPTLLLVTVVTLIMM